jgi:hypothetical protein
MVLVNAGGSSFRAVLFCNCLKRPLRIRVRILMFAMPKSSSWSHSATHWTKNLFSALPIILNINISTQILIKKEELNDRECQS